MKRLIAQVVLRLTRWGTDGDPPDEARFVAIAAPHTSNWDLFYLLMHGWYHDVDMSWLAKASLFVGPLGWLLRALGGIPVARGSRGGMVTTLVAEFDTARRLVVVIPPEGTRSWSDHWKSGFYRVALAVHVPIVCVYLDYGSRVGGFGPAVVPSGDVDEDMALIRAFYADKAGKFPEQKSEIRLRPEHDARTAPSAPAGPAA
jgi:1-acyl-sn-glycerol-3-phosphate acyltransferase